MQRAILRFGKLEWLIDGCCFVSIIPGPTLADGVVTLANVVDPGQISANEPIADVFSAENAARYLDTASLHWQKSRNCAACHVNMGYMFARPALNSVLEDSGEVRSLFEEYVTKRWIERPPRNSQEIVVVASGLAFNDLQTTDRLHPITRQALRVMWDFQREDGGWNWRNDGYPPVEYDEHYGVTLAALITGIAPDRYVYTSWLRRPVLRDKNGKLRSIGSIDFQATWEGSSDRNSRKGRWILTAVQKDYREFIETVNEEFAGKLSKPILMLPFGDVICKLDKCLKAGKIPGLDELYKRDPERIPNWDPQLGAKAGANILYADRSHPVAMPHLDGTIANYVIGLMYYSVLTGKSPIGLSGEPYKLGNEKDEELRNAPQTAVWDVVRNHPYTGIKSSKKE